VRVGHVAGVRAFGGFHTVLLGGRVEVPARTGEGRLALADGMDVERMLTRDGAFQRHLEEHAVRRLDELDAADIFAGRILQRRLRCRGLGLRRSGEGDGHAGHCHQAAHHSGDTHRVLRR
jgi:hypothetical protein